MMKFNVNINISSDNSRVVMFADSVEELFEKILTIYKSLNMIDTSISFEICSVYEGAKQADIVCVEKGIKKV